MALHALTLLFGQRLSFDVERYERQCELYVVPPPCPLDVTPADFSRSSELISAGYDTTKRWLMAGKPRPAGGQSQIVRPHGHRSPSADQQTSSAA